MPRERPYKALKRTAPDKCSGSLVSGPHFASRRASYLRLFPPSMTTSSGSPRNSSHVAARPCQVWGRAPRSGRGGVPIGSPGGPLPFVDTQKASLANLRGSSRLAEVGHENGGTTPFRCYPRDKSHPRAPVSLPICGFAHMGGMSSRGYVPETTKNRLKTGEKPRCRDLATGPSMRVTEGVY